MQNSKVDVWNYLVGNSPKYGDEYDVLEQLKAQTEYLSEEVDELRDAAEDVDWVEIVDAYADIKFVAAYLETLLKAVGVDTVGAFEDVVTNNMAKFTTSAELVELWYNEATQDVYIAETFYEGVTYFCIRNKETGKVVKPKDFEKVDLSRNIPKELLND